MKRIALWSRDHIIAARIAIAVCRIIMFCLAWYIGREFQRNSISISPSVFWLFSALFLMITFLFSNSYTSFRFYRRKLLDSLIVICSFIMVISFSNQKSECINFYKPLQGSFVKKKVNTLEVPAKPSVKELRKQFKALKMMTKKDGEASAGGIMLAILAAAAMGIVLAGAACSLSCNGQDALAVLLVIGGVTAIFFICRLILRGTRKKDSVNVSPF